MQLEIILSTPIDLRISEKIKIVTKYHLPTLPAHVVKAGRNQDADQLLNQKNAAVIQEQK